MHKLIGIGAILGLTTSTAFAQSSVTLFGVLDASVRTVHNDGAGSLNSLASGGMMPGRFGFRGTEDLGGGLSAGFWLEANVATDTGVAGTPAPGPFWNRRSIVSLSSDRLGEMRLGRDYVPTFLAWASQDPFGNTGVAFTSSFTGPNVPTIANAYGLGSRPDVWTNSAVQYLLPKTLGPVSGGLMFTVTGANAATARKLWGGSLSYDINALKLTAAHVNTRIDPVRDHHKDTVLSGSYDLGAAKLSAAVRRFTYLDSQQTNSMIAASIPYGNGQFKLAYVVGKSGGNIAGVSSSSVGGSLLGLGYVHRLSRRTAVYTNFGSLSNQATSTYTLQTSPATITPGGRSRGVELGIMHTF